MFLNTHQDHLRFRLCSKTHDTPFATSSRCNVTSVVVYPVQSLTKDLPKISQQSYP